MNLWSLHLSKYVRLEIRMLEELEEVEEVTLRRGTTCPL